MKRKLECPPRRVLILLPNWVGDAVMATPTLRAIRSHWPEARIVGLGRPSATTVLRGVEWVDELRTIDRSDHPLRVGLALRRDRFDLALILPNSWRSGLIARLSGARRRVGYGRDGRGPLLTDRLRPPRDERGLTPISAVDYYLALAGAIGVAPTGRDVALPLGQRESDEATALLRDAGVARGPAAPTSPTGPGDGPLVLLIPGASYGEAKRWPADRFAAVADQLAQRRGATVLLSGSPVERGVLDAVAAASRSGPIDLTRHGLDLAKLKPVVALCDLVITNDTGPRHLAAAVGTPVVTIFGPTDPRWSEIGFAGERQVRIDVPCSPCQLPTCPLAPPETHQCMTGIDPAVVVETAESLLDQPRRRRGP